MIKYHGFRSTQVLPNTIQYNRTVIPTAYGVQRATVQGIDASTTLLPTV
jgi:hypothetical protein